MTEATPVARLGWAGRVPGICGGPLLGRAGPSGFLLNIDTRSELLLIAGAGRCCSLFPCPPPNRRATAFARAVAGPS